MKRGMMFVLALGLFAVFAASPATAQKKKKDKDKEAKEEKFEKTGTSADGFLKAAFDLGQEMKKYNEAYAQASYYAYLLVTNPAGALGQDASAVVSAARQAGSLPATVNIGEVKGMIESKAADLKSIKDAAVKNSLTQLVDGVQGMVEGIAKIVPEATRLTAEAAALPDKLEKEMTGLQKAKLPKVLGKVNDGKSNLSTLQTEAPILANNVTELIAVLTLLIETVGS